MAEQKLNYIINGEDKSKKAFDSLDKSVAASAKSMARGVATAAKWGAAISGAAIAAGTVAVTQFAEFEATMSAVEAITVSTSDEMELMTEQAKELGRTTAFTAKEAAEGMKFLGMAGFDTMQIMEAMPSTLELAASTATDLATSADIVSNVIQSMGATAADTGKFVDVMARATSSANLDLIALGEAMKFAAPLSSQLGQSIDETTAQLGFMANAGIKGTLAGTGLQKILSRLTKEGGPAGKVMAELGIEVFNAQDEFRGLNVIVAEYEKATESMTDKQRTNTAGLVAGEIGLKSWLGLVQGGGEALADYTAMLEESEGAAATMAATMLDNTKGAWTIFMSAVSGATIELGGALAGALNLQGGLTGMADFINEVVTPAIKAMAPVLAEFAKTVVAVFKNDVMPVIQSVQAGLSSFMEWFNVHVTPVLVKAWEAISVALVLMKAAWDSNFLGIQTITKETWDFLKLTIETTLAVISGILDVFVGAATGDWDRALTGMSTTWNSVWNLIVEGLETNINKSIALINSLIRGINNIPKVNIPTINSVNFGESEQTFNQPQRIGAAAGILPRRAFGGSVQAGQEVMVGERGPERFTPARAGTITPNNQAGGNTQNITVQVTVNGDVYNRSMLDQITEGVKKVIRNDLRLSNVGIN